MFVKSLKGLLEINVEKSIVEEALATVDIGKTEGLFITTHGVYFCVGCLTVFDSFYF